MAKHLRLPAVLSSDVLPEYREYERLSTTVVHAYLAPVVRRYTGSLRRRLRGHSSRMMASQGGSLSLEEAARKSASMILSGPAAGVVAARTARTRFRRT